MRTTLTIDDAIIGELKELAHDSAKSFQEVVNETLRLGLAARQTPKRKRYRIRPASMGEVAPGIDLDMSLRLSEALTDQDKS